MSTYKGQAILLISGPGFQSELDGVRKEMDACLNSFSIEIKETQGICLVGRIIIATHILCDPAHINAIETDLRAALKSHVFDVAAELI